MVDQAAVIGDGQMATVCAVMLADRGIHVRLWSIFRDNIEAMKATRENRRYLPGLRLPERVSCTVDAAAAFHGSELIVSAVPCQYIRGVWEKLRPHYRPGLPVASVAKGIENDTLLRPTQIIADVLGDAAARGRGPLRPTAGAEDRPARHAGPTRRGSVPLPHGRVSLAALSGPSVAAELAKCLPATVVAASEDESLAKLVQEAFSSQWFRVYTNTDLLGVELAGASKNVIALAAGIVDGLKAGDNAKAALLTRGLVEISRLGVAMGARPETFAGLAGLGDLVTTCVSPLGRNRTAGEQIGRGKKVDEVVAATPFVIEGIATTRSVYQLARRHGVEMPITDAVYGVLFEGQDVIATLSRLMARKLKGEG